MTYKIGMCRFSARWAPHLLLPDQIWVRVKRYIGYCQLNNDEVDAFLNRVITCDETWIHLLEPKRIQQSSIQKHSLSPLLTKVLISKSAGKLMTIVSVIYLISLSN